MHLGAIYFWTATIHRWHRLLMPEENRDLIIRSLNELIVSGNIEVYGFVIMPNHIHIIWRLLKMKESEKPNASFLKYTAHELRKYLLRQGYLMRSGFIVNEHDRSTRIWQRDSLAIYLDRPEKAFQKLNYLHDNPMQEHWNLVERPADYKYSSACFYHGGGSCLLKISDLREVF